MNVLNSVKISHLYFDKESKQWVVQTNDEHSSGVSELAASFAKSIGMENWGKLIGIIHDRGKEKIDFQKYIKVKSGYDSNAGNYTDKSHSLIGAILLNEKFKDKCMVLPNIVAGHHRGLYDMDSLELLLNREVPKRSFLRYSKYCA